MNRPASRETFIRRNASIGYARLFAATGDFETSQQLLEEALIRYFNADGLVGGGTLDHVVADALQHYQPVTAEESSYSRSRRVRENDQAAALVRSYAAGDAVALFLEYVEEWNRSEIGAALERTVGDLDALNADLRRKLGDDAAVEALALRLRQHRLSPSFAASVTARLKSRVVPVSRVVLSRGFRGAACVLAGVALLSLRAGAWHYEEIHRPSAMAFLGISLPLIVDFMLLTASMLLRWEIAGRGLDAEKLGLAGQRTVMRIADHVGLTLLSAFALIHLQMMNGVNRILDRDLFMLLSIGRVVWELSAVYLVIRAVVRLVVPRPETDA